MWGQNHFLKMQLKQIIGHISLTTKDGLGLASNFQIIPSLIPNYVSLIVITMDGYVYNIQFNKDSSIKNEKITDDEKYFLIHKNLK